MNNSILDAKQALEQMKLGKKIHHVTWGEREYARLYTDGLICFFPADGDWGREKMSIRQFLNHAWTVGFIVV